MNWKVVCTLSSPLVASVTLASPVVPPPPAFVAPLPNLSAEARRGEHLAIIGGCHDCHTPTKLGPRGPAPDMSRMLSGHPEALDVPAAPVLGSPWALAAASTFTAFAGPWGVSFSANITPDRETGLGGWTEQNFIEAMRTGHHQGRGRPILPPMPWVVVAQHTDSELKAIWAYLQRVPPVRNQVPAARPPKPVAGAPASGTEGAAR